MRALVNSGGGSKGSFGMGVIRHLLGDLNIQYPIITGVSVGAINGSFLATHKLGNEKQASEELKQWWLSLDNSKIYKRWKPFGKIHAAWRMSFYDSSPLQNLVRTNISLDKIRATGKMISVGAVSISSGKYHSITQDDDDFIDAVLASSAFPGMFSPIKMKGHLWLDGGIKTLSPINTAIDLGATEIDVITTSPEVRIKKFIEKPNLIDIFKRTVDLSTDKILSNDIEKVLMYNLLAEAGISNKKVVKLRIFRPHNNLIDDVLNFDPIKIREMMALGYSDAKRLCSDGCQNLTIKPFNQ
jgi:NTE family protein